ncbi:MAG: hypothetical protein LBN07_03305 [Christensenellaceae bacterium]|jgi:hypothetical protein|nr:hypothetical protein [Christensenellaceae bacterium]
MGRNLFDFGDKDIEEKIAEKTEKLDEKTKENIQQLHQKYKNFSEQDLFEELKKQQQQGNLDKNKISQIIDKLGPFLNDNQRKFLMDTVNKLEE